jgi:hypothetical protein
MLSPAFSRFASTKPPLVIYGSRPQGDVAGALENLVAEHLGTAGFRREI